MTYDIPKSRALVLASASTWRRQVLEGEGLVFDAVDPDIDEKAIRHPTPQVMTMLIATAKAQAVLPKLDGRDAVVIAFDQVVDFRFQVREKPRDADEARRFLREYRGQEVRLITGVAAADSVTGLYCNGYEIAVVRFGPLPNEAIEAAIARGDVLGSCGAVVVEDPSLAPWVSIVSGSESCVKGLPLDELRGVLDWHRRYSWPDE